MADTEWWTRIGIQISGYAASSLVGGLVGIWQWGRSSAKAEQSIKDDYDAKIVALREWARASMSESEKSATARNELLVEQFKESFDGIRRQIDQLRLDTEREFMQKEDFREFRKEYREDMATLMKKIDHITARG
jgi:mevalonate pyrophosphate decarboxylase